MDCNVLRDRYAWTVMCRLVGVLQGGGGCAHAHACV